MVNNMDKYKDCFWFEHKWGAWEDVSETHSEHIYIHQIRRCVHCNKKKGRSIAYVKQVK